LAPHNGLSRIAGGRVERTDLQWFAVSSARVHARISYSRSVGAKPRKALRFGYFKRPRIVGVALCRRVNGPGTIADHPSSIACSVSGIA
jgi:hypothetical protein